MAVKNTLGKPDLTGDNKLTIGGSFETPGGVNLKSVARSMLVTNASGNAASEDFGFLHIDEAAVVSEFSAVMAGIGTGGAETLTISLGILGSPDVAISNSTLTFGINTPDGITQTIVPTGSEATLKKDEVLTFHVVGTLPTNWAVCVTVKWNLI